MAIKRIERTEYLNRLIAWRDKQLIKIITGIRRCGKSTLMEIYQDYLRTQGVQKAQMLSLNFEDYDLRELREPGKLYSYVLSHAAPGKMTYVFLDEIQHVRDWQEVVDSLFIKKKSGSLHYRFQRLSSVRRDRHTDFGKICGDPDAAAFLSGVCECDRHSG